MKLNSFMMKALFATLFVFFSSHVFADSGIVVSTVGKVEVLRNNQWISVGEGDSLEEGEVISTGFNSEMVLRYQESTLKMGALSRITLEKLSSSEVADGISVYVDTGIVSSSVNHKKDKRISYTVRNPIAVAHVRGTKFEMLGNGQLYCFNGAVELFPASSIDPKVDLSVETTGEEITAPLYEGYEEKYSSEKEAARAFKKAEKKRAKELKKQMKEERKRALKNKRAGKDVDETADINSAEDTGDSYSNSSEKGEKLPDLNVRLGRGGVLVRAGRKAVFSNKTGSPGIPQSDRANALEPYRKTMRDAAHKNSVRNMDVVNVTPGKSDN